MIRPPDDTSRHDAGRSLYGRSKARLPTGLASWPTRQGTSPIMVLMARVDAGCSQRAGPPGQLTARRDQTPGGYRMDAPTIGAVTPGKPSTHASATWAGLHPSRSATV